MQAKMKRISNSEGSFKWWLGAVLGAVGLSFLTFSASSQAAPSDAAPQAVEFNRDIRPILSDKCYTCHGPDSAKRLSKLRFDTEEGAKQDLGNRRFAIVPGDSAKSTLIARVNSKTPAGRMPLNGEQLGLETLGKWLLSRLIEFDKVGCTAPRQHVINIRLGNILADVSTPGFVVWEIGRRFQRQFLNHRLYLSCSFERRISLSFLFELKRCLIEALLQIVLRVPHRFNLPLEQQCPLPRICRI